VSIGEFALLAILVGASVALGLLIERKTIRKGLWPHGMPQEVVTVRRRLARYFVLYLSVLVCVATIAGVLSQSWGVALATLIGLMAVVPFVVTGLRVVRQRKTTG
jgi:hypothetical protein